MEKDRSAFKILTGKPTGKRPLGRPKRRWEDNIIIDIKEININTRLHRTGILESPCKCGIVPPGFYKPWS